MNCERFQSVVSDLARNDMIEASERISAVAHIDECQRCGQAWDHQRALTSGLRIVSERMKTLQAPAQLEEKLRASFRDRTSIRSRRPAAGQWRYWVSAAAAALLICFAVLAWRAQVASLPQKPINAKVVGPAASESPKPEQPLTVATGENQKRLDATSTEPKVESSKLARSQRARRSAGAARQKPPTVEPENALATNTGTKEVTTDFVALAYGSTLDLQDGGQLIRVEFPRSALMRFGLPMNMDRADERVKADVLVGADGLARAIRFVK